MTSAADTFGSYGRRAPLGASLRAARAADRLVTRAIALVLTLVVAFAGYSLWDTFRVITASDGLNKPTDAESFAALRAINPDVVAWLSVDGTKIDYPVVQGDDNFEYLNKDAKGEDSVSGSIFLDAACDPNFHEPYEVLYGHHMAYSKMFGDLDKFLDQSFFDQNSTAKLLLPDRTLSLEVELVLQADAYDGMVFGSPVTDAARMEQVVAYLNEHAMHRRSDGLSASDQLITLSTCASDGANARTVVVCRVVDEQQGVVG